MIRHIQLLSLCTFASSAMLTAAGTTLRPIEKDGVIGALTNEKPAFTWRVVPLADPKGGPKFASSGFVESLKTPSGFELNSIQPADHMHHLGLWWPWKFVEVGGHKYNTWEIQENQGAHLAKTATLEKTIDESLSWQLKNQTIIKNADGIAVPVIDESTTMTFARQGQDAHILDIEIRQSAMEVPVTITHYRYSGFSWRGTSAWNKDNSTMLTSAGKNRDNANGTPARWVLVTGETPVGKASMVIMSAAIKIAGTEENLRVWNSDTEHGAPFINLNPVQAKPMKLEPENKTVSHRKYRIIASDTAYDAAAAEAAWRSWMNE